MAYVIGFIIALILIGAISTKNDLDKGAKRLKEGLDNLRPASPGTTDGLHRDNLVTLLERLHIEGCAFGVSLPGATPASPALVRDPELSALLQRLMNDNLLTQVLPRLGFSIRSTATCGDPDYSRQYQRMLITPSLHAIGYKAAD